jgi:hypothetical protein
LKPAGLVKVGDGEDWWAVDTTELGTTACPGYVFAQNAADVCRGLHMQVLGVRPCDPANVGDAIAIEQSKKEIQEVMMDTLKKSGALDVKHRGRRDVRRLISLARH